MPYCSSCGEWVEVSDRFCDNCGSDVADAGRGWGENRRENAKSGRARDQRRREDREPGRTGDQRRRTTDDQRHAGGATGEGSAEERPHDDKHGFGMALSYPKADGWGPALLSGLLLIGSFLVFPAVMLVGYGYRVSRAAVLGRSKPPEYGDWGGLFVDGLRFIAVYTVIAAGFLVAALVVFAARPLFGILFGIVLYFVFMYVQNAFLAAFVASDSVADAFLDGRAVSLLTSSYYVKASLWGFALSITFNSIINILILTVIGWIWAAAYAVLAYGAYWGYVYHQAVEKGIVPPPVEDGEPPAPSAGTAGQPTR